MRGPSEEDHDFDRFFSNRTQKKLEKRKLRVPPTRSAFNDLPSRPDKKSNDYSLILEDRISASKDDDIRKARNSFMQHLENSQGQKLRIRLFIKCPGCFNDKSKESEASYWQHKECNTSVYIEETGYLSCENAKCKKFFIKRARFYCSRDHGVEYTQYTNMGDMLLAIGHGLESIKNGFQDKTKINEWSTMLAVNISLNWEKE